MSTIAIILARGGSKGLPRKNLLPLAGKPVVQWTLEHALATPGLDRIVLSTDSEELARIGRGCGVEAILRPAEVSDDRAAVDSAAKYSIRAVEQDGEIYQRIAILYGNVPIRPPNLTRRALDKLCQTNADSVQSVTAVGKHHPYWMKTLDGQSQDTLVPFMENRVDRRQDLPPVYELDGGVIAVARESLFTQPRLDAHTFLGTDRRAVICQRDQVIDIDHELDLRLAQAVLRTDQNNYEPLDGSPVQAPRAVSTY